jgi:hypothetical protein
MINGDKAHQENQKLCKVQSGDQLMTVNQIQEI